MLHSVSVGLNEADYKRFRGWEEGVVEWLQRCWRPDILNDLGVGLGEEAFTRDAGAVRQAAQAQTACLERHPDDYAMWDMGEPIAMLADALEAIAQESDAPQMPVAAAPV